ncbi:MAG: tetratricopeptide repeat protein [Thermoanaerobaculia bacterium]
MSGSSGRTGLWIFFAFTVIFVATTRGHFIGTDEVMLYQTAQSIWENGNLLTDSRLPATLPTRHGGAMGVLSPAQSVAALPLYALGRAVERTLKRAGKEDWIRTFAGGVLENGDSGYRWGGDVPIFFVDLFNAFVTAGLCSLFFLFASGLGASPRSALAATLLLGLTTYAAPFSTGFLQHPSEALLLLAAFFFLFRDSRRPSARLRAAAGGALALLILVRPPALVGVPALAIYAAVAIRRRGRSGVFSRRFTGEILPFLLPLATGLAVHLAVNHFKFGTWHLAGGYADKSFGTLSERFGLPSFTAVYGFLLSPGESIFFFTPLLCLLPWILPEFFRRHRSEAAAAAFLALSYFGFYSTFSLWHGLWSAMGPRYLMPIVPVLLLPLAEWMDSHGRRAWLAIAPMALAGFFVTVLNVAVNFAYAYNHDGLPAFHPEYGFLFIPNISPLASESRALIAGDGRVDMWIINVERTFGVGRFLEILVPLVAILAFCVWRIRRSMREAPLHAETPRLGRAVAAVAAVVAFVTVGGLAAASRHWPSKERTTREDALMKTGLDLFYAQRRPADAVEDFQRVLEMNPNHYGATFQLAFALESAGRSTEAKKEWARVLEMAERYKDTGTSENARQHLKGLR